MPSGSPSIFCGAWAHALVQGSVVHWGEQEEVAAAARVREVAYDLERRVRQELAFPAVVHFYTWLLQGTPLPHSLQPSGNHYHGFSTSGP